MGIHRLTLTSAFIDPRWMRRASQGIHDATIKEGGRLDVDGVGLTCQDSGASTIPIGTPVKVWLDASGHFCCEPSSDWEARAQAQRERKNREQHEAEEHDRRLRADTDSQGVEVERYGLILYSNWYSCRTGHGNHAVLHLVLPTELKAGRLTRKANELFCGKALTTIDLHDPDGRNPREMNGRVHRDCICVRCLEIYDRFVNEGVLTERRPIAARRDRAPEPS